MFSFCFGCRINRERCHVGHKPNEFSCDYDLRSPPKTHYSKVHRANIHEHTNIHNAHYTTTQHSQTCTWQTEMNSHYTPHNTLKSAYYFVDTPNKYDHTYNRIQCTLLPYTVHLTLTAGQSALQEHCIICFAIRHFSLFCYLKLYCSLTVQCTLLLDVHRSSATCACLKAECNTLHLATGYSALTTLMLCNVLLLAACNLQHVFSEVGPHSPVCLCFQV